MKKIFVLFIGLLFGQMGFTQDFRYEFNLVAMTEVADSKEAIEKIRAIMGVRSAKFIDDTNTFIIETHLDFDIEELILKFAANGIEIDGTITKIDLE